MVKGLKPMGSMSRMAGRHLQRGAIDWFLMGMVGAVLLASVAFSLRRTRGLFGDAPLPLGLAGQSHAFAIAEQIDSFNEDHTDNAIVFTDTFRDAFSTTPTLGKMATAVIYCGILTVAIIILPDMPARVVTPVHWIGLVGLGVGLAISCLTGWRYTITLGGKMV